MVFCIRCGSPINDEARFCPHCGQPRMASPTAQATVNEGHVVEAEHVQAPPKPQEGPEERRLRCERSSPVLHANSKIDGQLAYVVWMMRLLFVSIALMTAWKPGTYLRGIDGLMIVFILCFSLASAEFVYLRGRRSAGEAVLSPSGIVLSQVRIYGGLFTLRERVILKDEVAGVEVARGRDAPPTVLASHPKGAPTSLVLHLKNGKLITLHRRAPEDVLAAAEYAEVMWKVAKEDEAQRAPAKPQEVYREFLNDHRSNGLWIIWGMLAGMATCFIGLAGWGARNGISTAEALVDLFLLGMAAFMLVMIKMTYDRDHAVRSVRVENDGVALTLKRTTRFVPWADITAVRVIQGDAVSRERDRVAFLQISKARSYLVTREIGLAIEQAYRERTGREIPDPAAVPPKRGALAPADANVLKYENPALFRRNLMVSAALFANGVLLMINIAFRSGLLLAIGVTLLIALMTWRKQVSKEMRDFISRRNAEAGGRSN